VTAATETARSPCISICRMDAATGWCEGCLRTLDEIGTWSLLDTAEQRAVLAALPARRVHRRWLLAVQGRVPPGSAGEG
jgi:predicted Fe-S protein YdhL (DUF1289 family)